MNNILQYFEDACARIPQKTAVSTNNEELTFSDLRLSAKRLGAVIAQASQGAPIGVFANRNVHTVVYFLSVLYSGNFYVPLDPLLPPEKLASILEDAQIGAVIGDADTAAVLEAVGFTGTFLSMADAGSAECDMPDVGPDAPLYMVYTSGSTGKPKGVLKSHGAMISFVEAFCQAFSFSEDEVIGNQTPFYFDASAKDLYLFMKLGATLVIIPTELFSFTPTLMEYLNEKRITCALWVPTAISLVARLNPFSMVKPQTLRKLFFVGEVMPVKHLQVWRDSLPEIEYVNLYGQSEIAGVCCYHRVESADYDRDAIPIGKPMNHCAVRLLDTESGKVITGPGQVGELYISGPSLAIGYYRDAEKTSSAFLELDFGDGPVRCFKTGDLAQYDPCGDLVFASRGDHQIKHMGHRIELGEIENVALGCAGVARCCCLYNADSKKILLYFEPERGCDLTEAQLRKLLRSRLSSYMVPAKVVMLPALPLNANGKTDRRALAELSNQIK